jgi:hypothetical protein
MTGRQTHWQGVYQTKAETEVSWFQGRPETSVRLIEAAGLGRGARIIDVGGGASRLVDTLLDLGFTSLAVLDIAEAALAKTRDRLGARAAAVQWLVADITGWKPPSRYDTWHDRAVFHFLTDAADRAVYAATMASAVPVGGQAIVGTFAVDGPERCSGLPVCRYDADSLAAQFLPNFRLLDALTEDHLTPSEKVQRFQFCRMERI